MQVEKAKYLREKWGDILCTHTNMEREYRLGKQTGHLICTRCGKELSSSETASIILYKEVMKSILIFKNNNRLFEGRL